mgnify:CR=1 FL=1
MRRAGKVGVGQKKGRQSKLPAGKEERRSNVGLGLAQPHHAITGLPLAALAEELEALEALEDVAFDNDAGGALQAAML